MQRAVFTTLLLAACGAEAPVTENLKPLDLVETNVEELSSVDWNLEVSRRLRKFKEPELSQSQKKFSEKFSVQGEFGRKFVYLVDADKSLARAVSKKPRGLLKICPRYAGLSDAAKGRVWTSILDAIAFGETHYSTTLTYTEVFEDSSGSNVVSTGLFQLSQMSARNHGGSCKGATTEKLKIPSFNVLCAYRIMTNQVLRTGALFYDDRSFYYWSILSRGRNPKGFARFMGRLSQLIKDPRRWPQACGLPEKF